MTADPRKILLAGCAVGIVYGILNSLSNIFLLPSAPFISIRPQVALPMVVGILWHPLAGFLAGFLGNVIGDGISGFGFFKFWNWHICNGLMGFVPGLIACAGISRITTVREFGFLQLSVVAASAVGVGAAVVLDALFLHLMTFPSSFPSWILPAFLTDAVNGFVLVPIILIAAGRIELTLETRTILMISVLLIVTILATAAAITGSVIDDLVSHAAMVETFYIAAIVSVFLLVIGFVVSLVFVRKVTDPLADLTRAAEAVEKGHYDQTIPDRVLARADELGHLSRAFSQMTRTVHEREKNLRQQVEELKIKIDHEKQARDVSEIVETEYFRALKEKARKFRES
ncbi:MAG: HAMP domain-containing protein [Deltaproteobacteria bacterium]|nr:HAMP domain-containing protein [Deltaproteobacteria bacterium]